MPAQTLKSRLGVGCQAVRSISPLHFEFRALVARLPTKVKNAQGLARTSSKRVATGSSKSEV